MENTNCYSCNTVTSSILYCTHPAIPHFLTLHFSTHKHTSLFFLSSSSGLSPVLYISPSSDLVTFSSLFFFFTIPALSLHLYSVSPPPFLQSLLPSFVLYSLLPHSVFPQVKPRSSDFSSLCFALSHPSFFHYLLSFPPPLFISFAPSSLSPTFIFLLFHLHLPPLSIIIISLSISLTSI